MKPFNFFLPVILCLFLFSCAGGNKAKDNAQSSSESTSSEQVEGEDRGYIVKVGDMAPDFYFTTTSGETCKLSDLRGRIVMLQFTASWCSVCRKEMPFIERDIWQKYKDNPGFALYGIDRDEPLETVKEFALQTEITYPLVLDPGADLFALYADRSAGITRNVIVNRDGRIVFLTRLYDEEEFAAMCKKIDELMK
jgi:peroxiredoxin